MSDGVIELTQLSFRKPIITRGGNTVRLYHVYEDEIHGAYESDGRWYIASWKFDGHFFPPHNGKVHITSLDLINDEPIPEDDPRIAS